LDERAADRLVSDLEVDCYTAGASSKAVLYNVSTGGCMIEMPDEIPQEWEFVCLKIVDLAVIDGRIAWRHGCHAGVRFLHSLDPADVAQMGFQEPRRNTKAA